MIESRGDTYPTQGIRVIPFPKDFASLFPKPKGHVEDGWPSMQLKYLDVYLRELGCRTLVHEAHYVDRDFIADSALFYSRNLRSYPNYCQRIHFFSHRFTQKDWLNFIANARRSRRAETPRALLRSYLGFSVVRPLPGTPIGRTVLCTVSGKSPKGSTRTFDGVRTYSVHLGGFPLTVKGLAFQQQDQGVSACATTALWSALHRVAHREQLSVPTPAEITEGASRYLLADGRALPSEGLNIQQICEAIRASGLAPIVVKALSPAHDRGQLLGYVSSGFPPVLALLTQAGGHAVCCVGLKTGQVQPRTDPRLSFLDAASAVQGVYIHDDRNGPYAAADIIGTTHEKRFRTALRIHWPDKDVEIEQSVLMALVVPAPVKLRLSVTRIRALGAFVAQVTGLALPRWAGKLVLNSRYREASAYRELAFALKLSKDGLQRLAFDAVLSRYVGVAELSLGRRPILDVLLDATETRANPCVLACVRRVGWPRADLPALRALAAILNAPLIL